MDTPNRDEVIARRIQMVRKETAETAEQRFSAWGQLHTDKATVTSGTYEQAKQASRELDAKIASYPSCRMSARGPNTQQVRATEPGTKSRERVDAAIQGMDMASGPDQVIKRAWIGDREIDVKDVTLEMFGLKPDDQVE
tara:strand:- start:24 stop:440 length:417 start_codon:yes stop_codon:yes gene_type:complete